MNEAQKEAIANADSYLNNAGLPTYGQLVAVLQFVLEDGNTDLDYETAEIIRDTIAKTQNIC